MEALQEQLRVTCDYAVIIKIYNIVINPDGSSEVASGEEK